MNVGGPKTAPRHSAEQTLRTIGLLFKPGDVIEIRALNVDRGPNRAETTYSGYFNFEAGNEIATALTSVNGRADGIYVVLNQVNPALLARACNRLQAGPKHTPSDADIIEWRWIYIDVDPVRPAGISASAPERQAAHERRQFALPCGAIWLGGTGHVDDIISVGGERTDAQLDGNALRCTAVGSCQPQWRRLE